MKWLIQRVLPKLLDEAAPWLIDILAEFLLAVTPWKISWHGKQLVITAKIVRARRTKPAEE